MVSVDLNKDWHLKYFDAQESDYEIPANSQVIDLPFDVLTQGERDYFSEGVEYNGYARTQNIVIFKQLPNIEPDSVVILSLQGVSGLCEVFLNGTSLSTIAFSAKHYVDLTSHIQRHTPNILKLSIANFSQSGRYTGLGIAGSAKLLIAKSSVRILEDGVFVKTTKLDSKAQLSIFTQVKNDLTVTKRLTLCAEIFSSKNKRVAKKTKKIKLLAGQEKTIELIARLQRFYLWDSYDPNLYSVKVSILDDEAEASVLDTALSGFGIVSKAFTGRSLSVNNKPLKLKGAVVMHDNGILGNVSKEGAEIYKLTRIKELGFNAVRFIGCPTDAALSALDKLGLLCVVDIFDVLAKSSFLLDGHLFFDREFENITINTVKTLRQHPCVVMYGVCNNAEESYGRGGLKQVERIVELIRTFDPLSIVYANAFERVPLIGEAAKFDLKLSQKDLSSADANKRALSAAREKDLFKVCTEKYFSLVDIAGYSFLHNRYLLDKGIQGRMILGAATDRDKVFDVYEETEKNSNVLGDFVFAAADFLGSAKGMDKHVHKRQKPSVCTQGLLDKTYRKKDLAYYNEIVLGKKGAYIVVKDPDFEADGAVEANPSVDFSLKDASHLWNWPKNIGKPIVVRVLTSGDIVALFLDGKAVGRKLAGKFNRNYADFKTNFYPGKLEAVSFHKGLEQSRVTLESVTSPKMLKIECFTKTVKNDELCFFDVAVVDKEGRVVPYAMRNIEITISGEGELVALGNGDPEHFLPTDYNVCPTFNGYVTGVLKTKGEGKALIKATSEGLAAAKATIKSK